ncbi:uncharacterized protein IL334_007375 [Kwoniella shivajii]|uniref:Uncharacterized protein n=1 Tax=Kwoniella shivajii TaxID=564305 RepID=A0ABZ1DCG3_9TREE|nr:hypothetical protein IL334_007375 [Kwoniella shivajii]
MDVPNQMNSLTVEPDTQERNPATYSDLIGVLGGIAFLCIIATIFKKPIQSWWDYTVPTHCGKCGKTIDHIDKRTRVAVDIHRRILLCIPWTVWYHPNCATGKVVPKALDV